MKFKFYKLNKTFVAYLTMNLSWISAREISIYFELFFWHFEIKIDRKYFSFKK